MGVLARRFEEQRGYIDFVNDEEWGMGRQTSAGVRVNRALALSLTTVWRCIDLLVSAVAQAPKDVILKVGGRSFPEFRPPEWLTSPNPSDPTYTIDDYFAQVALSELLDGNYFTAALPSVLDPRALIPLDPQRVDVKPGPLYDIRNEFGTVIRTLGPLEMLHGTWIRLPGALRGIAPLEALRRGIGNAVAAEDYAGRFFGQGSTLAFGVEVQGTMDPQKKKDLEDSLRKKHSGNANAHMIGVLTGGAKFVPNLGPTPEQAQMLASRNFSVEDLCRPFGVPPAMAGSTEPGAASFAATDNYDKWFAQRAVQPLATRIENQHNRLLSVPIDVTAPDATVQFRFNLDAIYRASLLERYQAHAAGVQGGFLTPDEARGYEDLAPKPGGDRLYMQQQMVPIGTVPQQAPEVAA